MTALQRVKLRLSLKAISQCSLVFSVLILTAWITGKYVEALCFAISFCILRYRVTDILHCSTTFKCMLLTNGLVTVSIPICLPLTKTLFGGLITGVGVNLLANLISSNIFRMKEKAELEQLRQDRYRRDIYAMGEQELRAYCREGLLDSIDEEIVVQRLIYHLKGQQLYDKIGYSKPQMIRREKRIEDKLNIKLKDR